MKKGLFLIAAILAFGFSILNIEQIQAVASNFLYRSICDNPIPYSIGSIDSKFEITEEELKAFAEEAHGIWGNAAGKPLFVYDPDAELDISLNYDVRQQLNSQISDLNNNLEQKNKEMEPRIADYERRVSEFKARIAALNNEIDEWNKKNGAPPEVYRDLTERQNNLREEGNALNEEARSLNRSTQEYNLEVGKLNKTVDTFNKVLDYKPEEGIYIEDSEGKRIIIFFYTSESELVHTLAHEFGHALGMKHLEDENAIMFHSTNSSLNPSDSDTEELDAVCEKKNVLVVAANEFASRVNYLYGKVSGTEDEN